MTAIPAVLTLVLAGGKSDALRALGRIRTASALPYGGENPLSDFTLSHLVHSRLTRTAALTLVTVQAPNEEPERYGFVQADRSGRVPALEEKPKRPGGRMVSAAVYAFRARDLMVRLRRPEGGPDLVRAVILPMIREGAK